MLGIPERRKKQTGRTVRRLVLLVVLFTCSASFFILASLRLETPSLAPSEPTINPIQINESKEKQNNREEVTEPLEQAKQVEECYFVDGYSSCGYFRKAKCIGELLNESEYAAKVSITGGERSEYLSRLPKLKQGVSGNGVSNHKTSPFVRVGCEATKEFIGGASEFISYSRENFPELNFRACV
mmetsp:Transcript_25397/g.32318  ORF Transcript_25397/g.32318 Transcript_25397/m.32318 type:complete len:184 (+) Transcript_25397:349-900(+)